MPVRKRWSDLTPDEKCDQLRFNFERMLKASNSHGAQLDAANALIQDLLARVEALEGKKTPKRR